MNSEFDSSPIGDARVYAALLEAELEEKRHPEALSAEESDRRIKEIFSLMGVEYEPKRA